MKRSLKTVKKIISISPDAAWNIIGAVGGVDKWFAPLIQTCRVEGNKRFCQTDQGLLEENILEVNHDQKVLRYSIPVQTFMPVSNILGTMQVMDASDNQSMIEWTAEFDVEPDREEEARQRFEQAYSMGISGIEKYAQSLVAQA